MGVEHALIVNDFPLDKQKTVSYDDLVADSKASMKQLEDTLELYLVKKAPFQLPKNAKDLIVQFAPWATIIIMVIAIPAVLLVLGLGALVAPFSIFLGPAGAVSYSINYVLSALILAVTIVLELMAIPGLFARSRRGWRLLYYSALLGLVSNLFSFHIVNGIISALIGLYFLFQVREYYK